MSKARPRYEIPVAEDNGPTPERAAKSVFTAGRPSREQTVVDEIDLKDLPTSDEMNCVG